MKKTVDMVLEKTVLIGVRVKFDPMSVPVPVLAQLYHFVISE